ncbi:hypothetical protein FRB99_006315 [Tulasnella sp. 403]|nr:hypothetical protein FRB99_006315 [Tulasnella sp. 403]
MANTVPNLASPPVFTTFDTLSGAQPPHNQLTVVDDSKSRLIEGEEIVGHPASSSSSTITQPGEVMRDDPPIPPVTTSTPSPFVSRTRDFKIIPIPSRLRYHPDTPSNFTLFLNIIFGFASTAVAANLYYCQPLLVDFATSFRVSNEQISTIPSIVGAGYATGLLFITPLGDLVRRRPLLLLVLSCSTLLTLGVALSHNLQTLQALSYLQGVASVTPQILIPLAVDLAPPARRATAISVVLSGLLLGVIFARALGGVIAYESGSWRNVYWTGCGFQALLLVIMYLVLPDWPSKVELLAATPGEPANTKKLTYLGILGTMAKFTVTEPILIQGYLIGLGGMMVFSAFWVNLTFLLNGAPYYYSTLQIGLFGLVGILGVIAAPLVGRLIDGLVYWVGVLIAISILLVGQVVMSAAGGLSIGAIIVGCISMSGPLAPSRTGTDRPTTSEAVDIGVQMQQVAATSRIYEIDPALRARMNAVYMIAAFIGQVVGSAVGSQIFLNKGWRTAYCAAIGFVGFMLLVLLAKGPHSARYVWVGWDGGARLTKSEPSARDPEKVEMGKTQGGSTGAAR